MIEIKISKYILEKVRKFADARIEGSEKLYKSRGEPRVVKIHNDIMIGTLGEYAVYQLLKSKGLMCTKPDLKIYARGEKSFACDLTACNRNIHVKSQSTLSAERYGFSFICQRQDNLYLNPEENDLFAFCCVEPDLKVVKFHGFCNASDIKKFDLWCQCKVPSFRRSKVALYLTHFSDYDILRESLIKEIKK